MCLGRSDIYLVQLLKTLLLPLGVIQLKWLEIKRLIIFKIAKESIAPRIVVLSSSTFKFGTILNTRGKTALQNSHTNARICTKELIACDRARHQATLSLLIEPWHTGVKGWAAQFVSVDRGSIDTRTQRDIHHAALTWVVCTSNFTAKRSSISVFKAATLLRETLEFSLETLELNVFLFVEFDLNVVLVSKQCLLLWLILYDLSGYFLRHGLDAVHNGWW